MVVATTITTTITRTNFTTTEDQQLAGAQLKKQLAVKGTNT